MKKYNVNVNGTLYEITLEVVDGAAPVAAPTSAPVAAPAPVSAPAAAPAPVSQGAEAINSPMPGTILAVNVSVGQTVKAGDVLMILEAMKMENEITAPKAGTVTAVSVTKGASVDSGAQLCVIE